MTALTAHSRVSVCDRWCGPFQREFAKSWSRVSSPHALPIPIPSIRVVGASAGGSMVFVPLGLRSGSWTSHHGVAGCGSLQKGRWPTSSWRTGHQVKAREACICHSVRGAAPQAWPGLFGVMGTCPGNQRPQCTFKWPPFPTPFSCSNHCPQVL